MGLGDKKMNVGAGNGKHCAKRMPECDLITQQAIRLGEGWKSDLEKAAIISTNELKMSLASLAQSVTGTNESMKTLAETVKIDHELVVENQRQWRDTQEWQKQESLRHDREELEKKTALVAVELERKDTAKLLETERKVDANVLEQARKDRIKPVQDTMWKVIQWAVIFLLGIIATAVWSQYFR